MAPPRDLHRGHVRRQNVAKNVAMCKTDLRCSGPESVWCSVLNPKPNRGSLIRFVEMQRLDVGRFAGTARQKEQPPCSRDPGSGFVSDSNYICNTRTHEGQIEKTRSLQDHHTLPKRKGTTLVFSVKFGFVEAWGQCHANGHQTLSVLDRHPPPACPPRPWIRRYTLGCSGEPGRRQRDRVDTRSSL